MSLLCTILLHPKQFLYNWIFVCNRINRNLVSYERNMIFRNSYSSYHSFKTVVCVVESVTDRGFILHWIKIWYFQQPCMQKHSVFALILSWSKSKLSPFHANLNTFSIFLNNIPFLQSHPWVEIEIFGPLGF